jgi:hypothetical protein
VPFCEETDSSELRMGPQIGNWGIIAICDIADNCGN